MSNAANTISTTTAPNHNLKEARQIETSLIFVEPGFNAREVITPDSVRELAESIASQGLLHPITVVERSGRYQIIAGHRRFEAVKRLGWSTVPCVEMVQATVEQAAIVSMLENLSRQSLEPWEEVQAFARLKAVTKLSDRKLASQLGVSNVLVSERLLIAQYPELIEAMHHDGLAIKRAAKLASTAKKAKAETIDRATILDTLDVQDATKASSVAKRQETKAAQAAPDAAQAQVTQISTPVVAPMPSSDNADLDADLDDNQDIDLDPSDEETAAATAALLALGAKPKRSTAETTDAILTEAASSPARIELVPDAAQATPETVQPTPVVKTRLREKVQKGEPRMVEQITLVTFLDELEGLLAETERGTDIETFRSGIAYGLCMALGLNTDSVKLVRERPELEEGL